MASLDAQCKEHEEREMKRKEEEQADLARIKAIDRVMQMAADEEAAMREFEKNEIKNNWAAAVQYKQMMKAQEVDEPVDFNNVGKSAAQCFPGEDSNRRQRLREQMKQMQAWIQEKVAENAGKRQAQLNEDKDFKNLQLLLEQIQIDTDREEREMRQHVQSTVNKSNAELAKLQAQRKGKVLVKDCLSDFKAQETSFQMPEECNTLNEEGRIATKDSFRGLSVAQTRAILRENDVLIQMKREEERRNRQREHDWDEQSRLLQKAFDYAVLAEQQMRLEKQEEVAAILRSQRAEQQKREEESAKNRYGKIEFNQGYYNGFGKSVR